MRRHFWKVAMCALALAGASANAMPIGARTMMHGRVAVRQAAEEADRIAWTSNDGWLRQTDGSWKSGPTADGATNALTKTVNGAGTVTFRWKTSCEDYFYFKGMAIQQDALVFLVDGTEMGIANGIMSDWVERSFAVEGAGNHTIAWSYIKDSEGSDGEDCAWLDGVTWTPAEPIPPVASDDDVAPALAGTADANVAANVTNAAQYASYRVWALSVTNATTTVQMIKESTRTWLSYALGTDTLIDREFTSDDVKIESFAPTSADGKFEFSVSLKDVNIGGGSVAVETLKENLKKVLGLEGAATLDLGAFSSDNIDISFEAPVDGKARFTAKPPAGVGNSFFMRVKVKK